MAFKAVLDACVLYPFSLRDTLLRLAEQELYDPIWSDRILEEITRNLVANQLMDAAAAARLEQCMRDAFDGAAVPADAITRIEPGMTNHPKDRHVLAAAVAGGAEAIVTANLRDFPAGACAPFAITPLHPDDFLLTLHAKRPDVVTDVLREQAADLRKPHRTYEELLALLASSAPRFVAAIK